MCKIYDLHILNSKHNKKKSHTGSRRHIKSKMKSQSADAGPITLWGSFCICMDVQYKNKDTWVSETIEI